MKRLRQTIRKVVLMIVGLLLLLIVFGAVSVTTQGNRWFSSAANTYLRDRKTAAIPGSILDRRGVVLASTDDEGRRIYHPDEKVRKACVHVVGDRENNVGFGAESFMANYLYGFNTPYIRQVVAMLRGEKLLGNHVMLSIDGEVSAKIANVFPQGKKGAVVVMNYQTGEIIALLSFPNFDPDNITYTIKNDPARPFWNNATRWLSAPGSTFKVVTLASTLRNMKGCQERLFKCTGVIDFKSNQMRDANQVVHGVITLRDAFKESCNVTFGNLALELGDRKLKRTAKAFGIGDHFLFSDLVVENSSYPKNARTNKQLAWTGVGQDALALTPMHMCMIASAVANDGVMMEPKLLLKAVDENGKVRANLEPHAVKKPLSKEEADIISDFMREAILSGTGMKANVPGQRICGKTGSAQVDGQAETNAWFIGFIDEESIPYAICVAVMDVGGGGLVAAPVAGEIFKILFDFQ
ncbi:MAG: penicillin-binding transpeptidase domain-containing protein [Christensenellales bacterium]|jgi:peptidoglycan glycosyltransferase